MSEKIRILYLCTGNSCRSQMAEGYARMLGKKRIEARSAGLNAQGLNPRAIAVMAEDGLDISGQKSTRLTPEMLQWADLVVTLCGHADEHCEPLPSGVRKVHWSLADPASTIGTEDQVMSRFREIRDEVRRRVGELLDSVLAQTGR